LISSLNQMWSTEWDTNAVDDCPHCMLNDPSSKQMFIRYNSAGIICCFPNSSTIMDCGVSWSKSKRASCNRMIRDPFAAENDDGFGDVDLSTSWAYHSVLLGYVLCQHTTFSPSEYHEVVELQIPLCTPRTCSLAPTKGISVFRFG
jgi:hypothetical protein